MRAPLNLSSSDIFYSRCGLTKAVYYTLYLKRMSHQEMKKYV